MSYIISSFRIAGLPATPYPAPSLLDTQVKSVDSTTSPSRRRLPPTPGGSLSSSSPLSSVTMPEPMPYYPPGAIPPTSQSSYSFQTSSSSSPPSLTHRTTASSTMSDSSSRHHMQYSRSTTDGEKTPISSNEYPSHTSNTSYFSEISSGNYSSNTNTTADDRYRPPGALPPKVPSAHSSTSYSSQSLFDPYGNERIHDANGNQYFEPYHNQSHQIAPYNSQSFKPPPPPPTAAQHIASSNGHHIDSSARYADSRQASPPIDTSLCMSSLT